MGECSHNCDDCEKRRSGACNGEKVDFSVAANPKSKIKKVVAIMSGKGGVGKSMVTGLLAVAAAKRGYKTAILDADITGPSIPKAFGVTERAASDGENILPCRSAAGIGMMSLNLLVENPSDPVVWRGPVIAGAVKQFWSEVAWGDVDIMFVDMPPGTGDVPLTVLQSLPIAGVIVVTSPQDLVKLIVEKAVKMAGMMKVPILGIVENMSSFKCPDCGKVHHIFGEGKTSSLVKDYGIETFSSLPIDPKLAKLVDLGKIEESSVTELDGQIDALKL
jgi:Mrp family chromosome partitioning ATPase